MSKSQQFEAPTQSGGPGGMNPKNQPQMQARQEPMNAPGAQGNGGAAKAGPPPAEGMQRAGGAPDEASRARAGQPGRDRPRQGRDRAAEASRPDDAAVTQEVEAHMSEAARNMAATADDVISAAADAVSTAQIVMRPGMAAAGATFSLMTASMIVASAPLIASSVVMMSAVAGASQFYPRMMQAGLSRLGGGQSQPAG